MYIPLHSGLDCYTLSIHCKQEKKSYDACADEQAFQLVQLSIFLLI